MADVQQNNNGGLSAAGGTILGATIGGAFNLASQAINQQFYKENMETNYQYNEMAADAADARQRAQYWDLYSPQAKMAQIKAAGLSPSLVYANGGGGVVGGGGSATGAQGHGTQGQAPAYIQSPMSVMEGAQLGLIAAQTMKTKAEAKNIDEDTNRLKGESPRGIAELALLAQQKDNLKASAALSRADAELKNLQYLVDSQTMDIKIDILAKTASKLRYEMDTAYYQSIDQKTNTTLNLVTFKEQVMQINANLFNTMADSLLKESQAKLNDAERGFKKEQLQIAWTDMIVKFVQLGINEKSQKAQQKYWEDSIKATNKKLELQETDMWLDFGIDCANVALRAAEVGAKLIEANAKLLNGAIPF